MDFGSWGSLEAAKLFVGALTPVSLAVLGLYFNKSVKRFKHIQWRSQKLIERRLTAYDDITPLMNDVLCYFTYVGGWKELDPPTVIALKRKIDRKIYLNAPLFGKEFFSACMEFQNLCFDTFQGWGEDAKLKTEFGRRKAKSESWKVEWESCFTNNVTDPKDIQKSYSKVMKEFVADIGIHSGFFVPPSSDLPANIK